VKKISESKSWKELNNHLASLTTSQKSKEAGDIFEHVCKYYLQTASQYQSKLKNVWLLKEVKSDLRRKLNLPDTDEGIDLIAETYDKKYWAIQSKYRSNPKDTLTVKGDLATFANLAFNNCKHISHGLVLTTSDKPPLKTKLLRGVGFETLESFAGLDDSDYEGWKLIAAKATGKTIIPEALTPRPHQAEAIQKSFEYFKTNERGKMIMPCGTGKSLAAFWIARKLNAKSILIAVPSLALLQQTLKVWTREYLIAGIRPDWLCVCSDQTVSDDQDDFVSNIYDLGIDVTTDKKDIRKFLTNKNNNLKIVFTTYQSGKVTAQGAKGFKFDLGIMDEAHKTVGHGEKPMAHLIHQKNIKIKNRLFMTATERLFRGDKDEYVSMDDPRDYGEIIYQLSFKAAIEAKPQIIADYKIITFGISEPEIEAVYQDNKFIKIKKEIDDIKAREFATALALRKAIKKLGIRNAISFHSTIRRANNFKAQQELISKVYPEYGKLKAFHVSGDMPTNQRSSQMREFSKSKGLMTNARCLTEGVDLPAIDCVVFTDPKKSKVDIVQAAGRALRLSPGKKFGYILIPLIIPENENATEAAKDTAFEEIVATIRALATQDSRIIEYLRAVSSGTIPKGGSPVDGITKINVLTKVNEEEFNKAIQLKVWDRVAFGNWRPYEEAKKYVQSLKLNTVTEWLKYARGGQKPSDIPMHPGGSYKKVWKGYGDFLGTGRIADRDKIYRPFEKARKFARTLKLKNNNEWITFSKSGKLPNDIPRSISRTYKKEFKGMPDFLGINRYSTYYKTLSYKDTQNFAIKNKIKSSTEWFKFCKNNELPRGLPANPRAKHSKEWISWGSFLKTGRGADQWKKFLSYNVAKKILKKYNFKSVKEFTEKKYTKNFPKNIPMQPPTSYRHKGAWKGWTDFLSLKNNHNYARNVKKLDYEKAKKIIKRYGLKNQYRFSRLVTNNKKVPLSIPRDPKRFYEKKKQWKGWDDFLGKKK
jgi:superfamily II DNA or RNA helicase